MLNTIPKIIHYVWVGDKEKPDSVYKCIESWKKFCPDYEIIEWNNEKFKKIKNPYSTQAFENKKWAFVSDYIRLYALYNYGGIYLDTDVEITQNIDKFLVHDFVSGFEKWENIFSPITAFMGSKKENFAIHHFNGSWLDSYHRKNLFSIGKYCISRLKYRENKEQNVFPLTKHEKFILLTAINQNKYIALIKS